MQCSHCGSEENLYRKNIGSSGTHYYWCRDCIRENKKKYRQTPSGKAAIKRAREKYEAKNKHRRIAWEKCKNLADKPCQVCGELRVDKHHPDYSKPLEVIWLCRAHHTEEHRRIKNYSGIL